MKIYKLLFALQIAVVTALTPAYGQLSKITDAILGTEQDALEGMKGDSVPKSDSQTIAELTEQIRQLKQNEASYLLELEKTKGILFADSLHEQRKKDIIDSLKQFVQGTPVVIEDDTIRIFYTSYGGFTVPVRAANTEHNIRLLGDTRSVKPDSIYLLEVDDGEQIEIMYANKVITSVLKEDAMWLGTTLDSLAKKDRDAIVNVVKQLHKKNSFIHILKRIGLFLLVIAIQVALIYGTNWLYRKVRYRVARYAEKKLKPISIRDYELLTVKRLTQIIMFLFSIFRYIVILIQLIISIPILFSIFPQTKHLAMTLFGYILTPLKSIFASVIGYIPNLFTIIIIYYLIKFLIRGVKFLASEIEGERLKIPGFYPDWAMPTFNIIRFLLIAFMIAMIYPYLPGSSSGVFQGVSVFVGLIISLGSGSAIGNIIAGLVITYMRPFRIGDRVKLGDVIGDVTEKTPFVTRIKTPLNEIITVPNSTILSSQVTNLSLSASDYGLIVHTKITIGYEVPWQVAHEVLMKAAKATEGTMKDKEPFVFETGLDDYYNTYQVFVYIDDARKAPGVITNLNASIQDMLFQEGIDIESPILISERKQSPRYKKKEE